MKRSIGFIAAVLLAAACGGDGTMTTGTTGGSTTGGSTTGGSTTGGSSSGSTSGGSSTTTTTGGSSSTTTNGTTGGAGNCVEEDMTFTTSLPYTSSDPFTDQDCTSSTAKSCPSGKCVEWEDKTGRHGKCFVYCSELASMPAVGSACTSFATCRSFKGASICVPNILNLCGASTSGSTTGGSTTGGSTTGGSTTGGSTTGGSTTGGSTTGGSTTGGSTTGGGCKSGGQSCTSDTECCSDWCNFDNKCES